jgi:hypothetical protein
MQSVTLPVEVVERQSSNLAGTQPVRDHEQQHGASGKAFVAAGS